MNLVDGIFPATLDSGLNKSRLWSTSWYLFEKNMNRQMHEPTEARPLVSCTDRGSIIVFDSNIAESAGCRQRHLRRRRRDPDPSGIEGEVQGYLAHEKLLPPRTLHCTAGLCQGPCGDPRGVGVSYDRGTPVLKPCHATRHLSPPGTHTSWPTLLIATH